MQLSSFGHLIRMKNESPMKKYALQNNIEGNNGENQEELEIITAKLVDETQVLIREGQKLKKTPNGVRGTGYVVMLILGCFSLCWLPYFVVVICLKLFGDVSTILYEITFTMAMMNSCMNPIIYAWKNPGFRKAFWCMMRCKSPNQNGSGENFVTNHTPIYNIKSNGKSDSISNHTEIEMCDGKSQSEDNRDWDQESTDNTIITIASTVTKDIQNYI